MIIICGGGEGDSNTTLITKVRGGLIEMAHVFALALCAYVIYLSKPGTSLFSWHPTLMVLGFGLFMFEAILIFSPESSLLSNADRKTKVKYHWILQVLANLCIALGFAAIYYNKDLNNKPHFTSWHGTLGVISVGFIFAQSLMALSLIWYNVKWLNPLQATLALRKKLHAVSGALSYVIGYVALVLSLYSKFIAKNTGETSWYVLFILMSFIASVVVNQVSNAYIFKGNRLLVKPRGDIRLNNDVKVSSQPTVNTKSNSSRKQKSHK